VQGQLDTYMLSGGRAYLGIGAAWFEREALGLGGLFPALKEHLERLEEALQIAKQMWSGQIAPFQGSYHETKKAPRLEGLGRALRRQARPAPSVARQT
jgi:alkanesulfonate monooxygenase SsuD/methylene tetrahydromethanopterin reductase-like flavin-dependent oxidoreductase (luciferase family)